MAKKHDDDETAWYLQNGFLVSTGFLAALLVVGIVLVVTGPRHTSSAATPGPTTAAAPPSFGAATPAATPAAGPPTIASAPPSTPVSQMSRRADTVAPPGDSATASVCGLAPGSQIIPTAPPSATWRFVGSIAVPGSPRFGPGSNVGGIGNCYAHSPTGALVALVNTLALTEVGSDKISAVAVVQQRGSRTGDYAQALAEAKQQDSRAAMPADASTSQRITVLGYRYVDYTPARATIAVALGLGDPGRQATYQPCLITASVAWEGGDWKFVYSASTATTTAPIISTEQYTPWAA